MYKIGSTNPVSENFQTRLLEEFCNVKSNCVVWDYMYRLHFLKENNLKFINLYGEDQFFLVDILCATSKICKIDKPFYIYRLREDSSCRPDASNINKMRQRIQHLLVAADYFEEVLPKSFERNNGNFIFMQYISTILLKRYIQFQILPFYRTSPEKFLNILQEEFRSTFEKNNMFVMTIINHLLNDYIIESNIQSENYKLKTQMSNIYKQIGDLIK